MKIFIQNRDLLTVTKMLYNIDYIWSPRDKNLLSSLNESSGIGRPS